MIAVSMRCSNVVLIAALWLPVAACARATSAPASSAAPLSTHAEHQSQAASAAHDHAAGMPPVTIPPGSLITEADVRFMQGMIAHHAQAVHMTRLAAGAGASARVLKLAQKIDLSQAGEITLMQEWLRSHGQFAPDTSAWRSMQMAGMLTAEELSRLAAARGVEFDRLFLRLMIRHHEGAIQMVAQLLSTPRAAQDIDVNILANDVETTQTAEIGLMWQMLAELD